MTTAILISFYIAGCAFIFCVILGCLGMGFMGYQFEKWYHWTNFVIVGTAIALLTVFIIGGYKLFGGTL